jgi:16S rRNA (uracil1498-N3)-methyltransferase
MTCPTDKPPTFYVAGASPDAIPESLALGRDALRHIRALRLREGAAVRITDGHGMLWAGRLEGSSSRPTCVLEARLPAQPLLPVELAFGIAAKPRTLWLVEKAVELGAGAMQPIELRRSASVADAARSGGFWTRAGRRAQAALEQSGGAWLPELRPPASLSSYLARAASGFDEASWRLLLSPSAELELGERIEGWDGQVALTLLVGTEGGMEGDEIDLCEKAGFTRVRLGGRILRFETAAIAALAVASQRAAAAGKE